MTVHQNCIHFRGDVPCKPHKKSGFHCDSCPEFQPVSEVILIIKLGAIGDVIRTTPLLRVLREKHPAAYIYWFTYTPEIVPAQYVQRSLNVTPENIELLKNIQFDWLINLDKDPIAISLASSVKAKKKSGFTIDRFGHAVPIGTPAEEHKWLTGLFDDLNQSNTKHYVEEVFDIAGYKFNGEEYIIDLIPTDTQFSIDKSKKVVGLNTGCGGRWVSRLWPTEYWIKLAKDLQNVGYEVVLLGGKQEDEKNVFIQKESGAKYFGYFPLPVFVNLMNECDLIVSSVSMAMHIAIALKKRLVLFNNIFNKNEFHLYDRGIILEPEFDCPCYFTPVCPNNCMQYLKPETVFNSIKTILRK
jgi:ADP-heptose:LPS heptosyltransferase